MFLIIGIGLLLHARSNYGSLEGNGYPVIPPSLFLGSVPDLHKKPQYLEDIQRAQKYGPIWGLYEGRIAQVHVADPDLARLILVKDFDSFLNRRDVDFGSPLFNGILAFMPGEKWKTVRSLLSPLFTTAKLKFMTEVIESHAEEYMQDLKKAAKPSGRIKYDCQKELSTWLIDMFSRSTLGIKMNNSKDTDNAFANAFRTLMGEDITYGWMNTLSMSFPFLSMLSPRFDNSPEHVIESTVQSILASRRESGLKRSNDFVDILNDIYQRAETPEFQRLGITQSTVTCIAFGFFLGGYDTTSVTLSHLLYYLALSPNIQEELFAEVEAKFPGLHPEINYDTVKEENIPFTSACVSEALRIAPSFPRPERVCTKDWSHNGIRIKRGTPVFIATWAAHRNPELYPEPAEFRPERFLKGNKDRLNPYAFMTFGYGPRACIAIRFAYESLKVFLIQLIRNFRIEMREDTVLGYKPGSLLMVQFDKPLFLDLVVRDM